MKPYASYKPSGVSWLGDLPSHWRTEKVKFQAHLRGEKSAGAAGVRYVGMEHVLPRVGKFNPTIEGTQEDAESTVNVFAKGDVLFGKLRPYLAKCVVADTDGVCSSEFLVLTPAGDIRPAYLNATMLMQDFIDAVDASTYGAKMPRADWGFIGQQRLPLPPPDEQQAIADYLDTETARIDTLIREKDELIGLLKEWRQSVIAEAVTKGLEKNAAMKPSGVPWLGEIPEHWEVIKTSHLLEGIKDGTHGTYQRVDNGRSLLSAKNVQNGFLFQGDAESSISEEDHIGITSNGYPAKGDVLLTIVGSIGRSCVYELDFPIAFQRSVCFLRFGEKCFSKYIYYLMQSNGYQDDLLNRAKVSAQGGVYMGDVKKIFISVPPLPEQKAIAEYLDAETAKIDNLITHTHDEIALLKELRAATIADAVLGRIDVRTAAHS